MKWWGQNVGLVCINLGGNALFSALQLYVDVILQSAQQTCAGVNLAVCHGVGRETVPVLRSCLSRLCHNEHSLGGKKEENIYLSA